MSDHKLEKRTREIYENYCADPGCEFNGKYAAQGVCFSMEPEVTDSLKVFDVAKKLADELLNIRQQEFAQDPAEYIRWLEAMYETAMMNEIATLDECVRLRVENRRLKESAK